jgi:hypothetical protein
MMPDSAQVCPEEKSVIYKEEIKKTHPSHPAKRMYLTVCTGAHKGLQFPIPVQKFTFAN